VERTVKNHKLGGETVFHRVTIIGFVGSDPSLRYTPEGTPLCNFSVATRQVVSKERAATCPTGWKESLNGKNWELTTWLRVTCAPRSA
jgi:single-stranded DNA-binding protein